MFQMGNYKQHLWSLALLIITLPVIIVATQTSQRLFPQAAEPIPTSVQISPGEIITTVTSRPVYISALAYDQSGLAIHSGITYEWGVSSSNSIISLIPTNNIASIYAINDGIGHIWVKASNSSGWAMGSIRVVVGPNAITPTPPPFPTLTPKPILIPTPTPFIPTPTPVSRWIKVVTPNGGETLYKGETYRITWDSTPSIDSIYLGYSFGPGSLNWIATNIPNNGYYDWLVNIGNTLNNQVKIQVTGYDTGIGSATDQSDNFFTVIPRPTATPTPIPIPSPTPIPYSVKIQPLDDTYLNFKNTKTSHGNDSLLEVDGWPATENIYLQFQNPTDSSSSARILSAKLRFKVSNSSVTNQTLHLIPNTNWSESTLSLSTAPSLNNPIGQINPISLSGSYRDINLTDFPTSISSLGSKFTIRFNAPTSSYDALGVYSSETSSPPELLLTIQP